MSFKSSVPLDHICQVLLDVNYYLSVHVCVFKEKGEIMTFIQFHFWLTQSKIFVTAETFQDSLIFILMAPTGHGLQEMLTTYWWENLWIMNVSFLTKSGWNNSDITLG